MNAYSVALSFYETYGIVSHAFGRYRCGITELSRFVKTHVVKDLDQEEVGIAALLSFAEKSRKNELFLVPCSDWHLSFLEKSREKLKAYFSFFIPPSDVFFEMSNKKRFYEALEKEGISYPKTAYLDSPLAIEKIINNREIPYPAVLKPSDSTAYYRHPFLGMQKVYFPKNREEAKNIALTIFASGYDKELILQSFVKKQNAGTLTVLVGKDGRIRRGVLGMVLLEENAPTARGNYAAIVTTPMDEISHRLLSFCQKIGYTGIANFDILYGEDEKAYVLEMNPRQGRSSDYLRGCGISLAAFLRMEAEGDVYPPRMIYPGIYWRAVSHKTVRKHADSAELLSLADQYRKNGFSFSPFHQTADMRLRPLRASYVWIHERRRGNVFEKIKETGWAL